MMPLATCSRPSSTPAMLGQDLLLHLPHHPIRGGQEKLALAGEMAVNRPLAELQPFGQSLRDCI